MKDLPIRNIFLPATLVGASIFSALAFSLPIVLHQHTQKTTPETAEISSRSPLTLTGIHKEVAIAYIGTTIVVSASAGLGVAELLRKRSQKQPPKPDLKAALAEFIDHHANEGAAGWEEQLSSVWANLPTEAKDLGWLNSDTAEAIAPGTPAPPRYEFPKEMPEALWQSSDANVTTPPPQTPTPSPEGTVIIFPGQYQRCCIQVPGLLEPQYAIEFDQQFYRLLSSGATKEQALMAVKQLAEDQRAAILTQTSEGYGVWLMEPQAKLVSVA